MSIEIKNLTVNVAGKKILDDVSVTFEENKTTVVIGPNGCGKTTLIKELIKQYADKKNLSYVAQETVGYLNLKVEEVVELSRYNGSKFFSGLSKEDVELVDNAMKKMGVEDKRNQLFDTLSGGEKQRVMMARALSQNADWLILDEPTSNLDAAHVRKINDSVKGSKSAIVVMHDINEAARLGDVFILMKNGRVIAKVEELTEDLLSQTFDMSFNKMVTSDGQTIFFLKAEQ